MIGTSDEYRDRPFKRRNRDIPRETVYVGNELTVFDAGAAQRTAEIVKDKEEFWVSYAGTIGTSYDIRTMVLAGEELAKRGMPQIKIKILGAGPMKEELEELANSRKISNVEFVGYAPYDLMAAYLKKSDILVNSLLRRLRRALSRRLRLSGSRKTNDQYLYESGIPCEGEKRWLWCEYYSGRCEYSCGYD